MLYSWCTMKNKQPTHSHLWWNPSTKMLRTEKDAQGRMLGSDGEFVDAFKVLNKYPKRVTFFGSARDTPEGESYRDAAYKIAFELGKRGYAILSGGGSGIMAASNRGAYDAGGHSIGFNIRLPHEQHLNPYTTDNLAFHYFFTRKVTMTFFSHAYIFFPGGFGTLDELTEIITMIQTHKMPPLRIVLFGHAFWDDFAAFVQKQLLANGYITPGDEKIYIITDDIDEAVHTVDCVAEARPPLTPLIVQEQ